jgi:hypothetical protein
VASDLQRRIFDLVTPPSGTRDGGVAFPGHLAGPGALHGGQTLLGTIPSLKCENPYRLLAAMPPGPGVSSEGGTQGGTLTCAFAERVRRVVMFGVSQRSELRVCERVSACRVLRRVALSACVRAVVVQASACVVQLC